MSALAFSLSVFSSCNLRIASSPSGVAALPRPSILAVTFIEIAFAVPPFISMRGKTIFSSGDKMRQITEVSPDFSAISISPLHKHIVPARRMHKFTASEALEIIAPESKSVLLAKNDEITAKTIIPAQI